MPLTAAETVFASATVELTVPVATPSAPVTAAGWVAVFPLPVACRTRGASVLGLPSASFAAAAFAAGPLPAVVAVGAAAAGDWLAVGAAAVTVTAAVCVIAMPLIVAEIVFASAT